MSFTNEYLKQAADNIVVGLRGLLDSNNDKLLGTVQNFLYPYPTTPSWACVHMFGASLTITPMTDYKTSQQTWTFPVRVGVGSIEQGYTGVQQWRLFTIVPQVVNMFITHPDLTFEGATTIPAYFIPSYIGIADTRPGIEDLNEGGRFIFAEIFVELAFNVQVQVIKHKPNGEEYIV